MDHVRPYESQVISEGKSRSINFLESDYRKLGAFVGDTSSLHILNWLDT